LLEQAGEVAREILDGRILEWTGRGWTQQQIADEIGCSQRGVSKRQARLGIAPSQPHAPRGSKNRVLTSSNGSDPEVVDAEVVPDPTPGRGREREPQLADYLLDMLPGAEPEGAFRQAVKAWCDQGRSIVGAMDETGVELTPKSDRDRDALRGRLTEIHEVAARLERQLER
jgi:hypothetical protein